MKLEIKVNKDGTCEYLKINDNKYGKGITGYRIFHEAGSKPRVILECYVDEFILDSEDNKLYLEKIKDENEE